MWDKLGQRWTPFFNLPYFNFFLDNIPEPMHLFRLGIIEDHISQCLAYQVREKKSSFKPPARMPRAPEDEILAFYKLLLAADTPAARDEFERKLNKMGQHYSWTMCIDLGLRSLGHKQHRNKALTNWVCANGRQPQHAWASAF